MFTWGSSIELNVGSFLEALETDSRSRTQILKLLQTICHIHCTHLAASSQIVWMNVFLIIQSRTWLWSMPVRILVLYQLWKQLAVPLLFVLSFHQCALISGIASLFHFLWTNQFTKRLFAHFLYLLESLRRSRRRWHLWYPTSVYFVFISSNRWSIPFNWFISLVTKISCRHSLIFQHHTLSRFKIAYHVSVLIRSQFYIVVYLKLNFLLYSKQQVSLIVNLCEVFML